MIRSHQINLPYIMVMNLIMGHDQKQNPFHMIMTPYSSLMEINNRTLLLNDYGVWVSRDQIGVHVEEEQQRGGSDDEFEIMFKTPPTISSFKKVGTSTWKSRVKERL